MTPAGSAVQEAVVNPRMAKRREDVAAERRRRIRRRAAWVLATVSLVAGLWWFAHSPWADINEVVITGVGLHDAEEVTAAGGVAVGDPLVTVRPSSVASGVATLAAVDTAEVSRDWLSGTVTISVTERVPVAVVTGSDNPVVVDAEAVVLGADRNTGLVRIIGVDAPPTGDRLGGQAADLAAVAGGLTPGLASNLGDLRLDAANGVVATVVDGGEILLGSAQDLSEKVRTLQTVLATVELGCLAQLDVRVPGSAVLTRDPGCG